MNVESPAQRAEASAVRALGAPLTEDLSFLLARANALSLAAGNKALSEHGLKVRSYSVLALAGSDARPSQRELAEFLRLDPSQVVALVDDLEARALVRRDPDPTDRRANVVSVTDAGRALLARAAQSTRAAEHKLHNDFTGGERIQLAELLRRLAFP